MKARRDFLKIAGVAAPATSLPGTASASDRPLDADYQPTSAFFALRDAIDTRRMKA